MEVLGIIFCILIICVVLAVLGAVGKALSFMLSIVGDLMADGCGCIITAVIIVFVIIALCSVI